jgi:hypothetical protein
MKTIKPFRYIPELDCFVVTQQFAELADRLGLTEWSPVVFLGRLFARDNDFGEHWFDNWSEREELAEKTKEFGIENNTELLIIVPQKFSDGLD